MDAAVEQRPLRLRLVFAVADDDETAREDLDVVAVAARRRCAALDVGIGGLSVTSATKITRL